MTSIDPANNLNTIQPSGFHVEETVLSEDMFSNLGIELDAVFTGGVPDLAHPIDAGVSGSPDIRPTIFDQASETHDAQMGFMNSLYIAHQLDSSNIGEGSPNASQAAPQSQPVRAPQSKPSAPLQPEIDSTQTQSYSQPVTTSIHSGAISASPETPMFNQNKDFILKNFLELAFPNRKPDELHLGPGDTSFDKTIAQLIRRLDPETITRIDIKRLGKENENECVISFDKYGCTSKEQAIAFLEKMQRELNNSASRMEDEIRGQDENGQFKGVTFDHIQKTASDYIDALAQNRGDDNINVITAFDTSEFERRVRNGEDTGAIRRTKKEHIEYHENLKKMASVSVAPSENENEKNKENKKSSEINQDQNLVADFGQMINQDQQKALLKKIDDNLDVVRKESTQAQEEHLKAQAEDDIKKQIQLENLRKIR